MTTTTAFLMKCTVATLRASGVTGAPPECLLLSVPALCKARLDERSRQRQRRLRHTQQGHTAVAAPSELNLSEGERRSTPPRCVGFGVGKQRRSCCTVTLGIEVKSSPLSRAIACAKARAEGACTEGASAQLAPGSRFRNAGPVILVHRMQPPTQRTEQPTPAISKALSLLVQ